MEKHEVTQDDVVQESHDEAEEPQQEVTQEPEIKKKSSKKKKWIFSIVTVLLLIGAGVGTYLYIDKKNKELAEEYEADIELVADKIISSGSVAEDMINNYSSVWHDAIYEDFYQIDGEYVSDFNEAIQIQYAKHSTEGLNKVIEDDLENIKSDIKDLNDPPEEFEDAYEALLNLYKSYSSFANLALTPDGSLTTYNETTNSLGSEVVSNYEEFSLKMP